VTAVLRSLLVVPGLGVIGSRTISERVLLSTAMEDEANDPGEHLPDDAKRAKQEDNEDGREQFLKQRAATPVSADLLRNV
jgi:hypothetical protein